MKRLIALLLALAGLTALLANCGGEEETGVLAVAFRLDGESPVLSAYVGDPAEDPFELPAGSYYIEAVDQDDVVISLGTVDIAAGDIVDFPPSFAKAGGLADLEHAESLKTVGGFLVDFELAELTFLEIITGGFATLPFEPAVEPDAADVEELFEIYADIVVEQDAVEAALSEIEEEAEVSLGVSYVRSPWAPAPGLPEVAWKKLTDWAKGTYGFFFDVLTSGNRKRILEIVDKIPQEKREEIFYKLSSDAQGNAANFDEWIKKVEEDDWFLIKQGAGIYHQLDGLAPEAVAESGNRAIQVLAEEGPKGVNYATDKLVEIYKKVPLVGKLIEAHELGQQWEKWAKKFTEDMGAALDEKARAKAQADLEEAIKNYLKEKAVDLPTFTDTAIDEAAKAIAKTIVSKVPKLPSSLATPAAATPKATPKATAAATAAATPAPATTAAPVATATPAPDSEWLVPGSGWIEGYVQGIASEWVAKCFKGDVKPYADALRQCLINAMLDGATEEQAKADCPPDAYAPTLPDAGWIEGYVNGIADQWLAKDIYSGIDVAVAADDMRQCLTDRFMTLCLSEEESKAECPAWLFEPVLTPEATATPTPEATPTPQPTETPEPEPTETPTPAPIPGGDQVRAEGPWLVSYEDPGPNCEVKVNTMWVVFPSNGGEVRGEGHWLLSCATDCGTVTTNQDTEYKGNYSPDSGTLSGSWLMEITGNYYTGEGATCELHTSTTQSSGAWQATFDGKQLGGDFEYLTVQGQ